MKKRLVLVALLLTIAIQFTSYAEEPKPIKEPLVTEETANNPVEVTLYDGTVYSGELISEDSQTLVIRTEDGIVELQKQRSVRSIIYANGEEKVFEDTRTLDERKQDSPAWNSWITLIILAVLVTLVSG